ncbi:MAG: hypothetical protein DWH79_03545 [Planctomycetota bacterium]|nr:MAG: hypothetical protein DWH79_03545 [Planctomycetota bacterium]
MAILGQGTGANRRWASWWQRALASTLGMIPVACLLVLGTLVPPPPEVWAQPGSAPPRPRQANKTRATPPQTPAAPQTPALPTPPSAGLDTPKSTLGYALGLIKGSTIAEEFKAQKAPFDYAAYAQGFSDAMNGVPARLPEEQIASALREFWGQMEKEQEVFRREMVERGKVHQEKGAEFLAANATRKGVIKLPSGLQYEVLTAGSGPKPKPTDIVSTQYRGTHIDGQTFDATNAEQPSAKFAVEEAVPGWQEALPLMAVGSRWRLVLPTELAYGEEGLPPLIEPNEVLVYELKLLRIEPPRRAGGD